MFKFVENFSKDKTSTAKSMGYGKIDILNSKKTLDFEIIEISTNKIRISTNTKLNIGSEISLRAYFNGLLIQLEVKTNGKVIEEIDGKYEVEFLNLSDNDQAEIKQLVESNCVSC